MHIDLKRITSTRQFLHLSMSLCVALMGLFNHLRRILLYKYITFYLFLYC